MQKTDRCCGLPRQEEGSLTPARHSDLLSQDHWPAGVACKTYSIFTIWSFHVPLQKPLKLCLLWNLLLSLWLSESVLFHGENCAMRIQMTGLGPGSGYYERVCACVCACVHVHAQSCPTLCDSMDCGPPVSCVHGFSRQEYWNGLPFPSPGYLWPRDQTWVSCIAGRFFAIWATREAQLICIYPKDNKDNIISIK